MPDPLPQSILCPILIGCDAQVAALTRLLEQARDGQGPIVLISGEAGIGKSRLVAEAKKLAADHNMTIQQGNCIFKDAETGSTWNILGEAFEGPLAGKQLTQVVAFDHF